jgi:hypothetical protein
LLSEGETTNAGWSGGFDIVLGNPPWERIKLQEKEWFAQRRPEIANAPNASARQRLIRELLETDPALHEAFLDDRRKAEGESHLVRNGGRYPLCGRGDINTYAIFAETNRALMSERGRVGCIVPSGIAFQDTTKFFFQDLISTQSLASLYSFFEIRQLFPDTDSREPFCLLTLTGKERPAQAGAQFFFNAYSVEDLNIQQRRFTLTADEIALLNPNTQTCPVFRTRRDAELTKSIYARVPVLINQSSAEGNPWQVYYLRLVDYGDYSEELLTADQCLNDGFDASKNVWLKQENKRLPVYESKLVNAYDHRFASYGKSEVIELSSDEKQDANRFVTPRYWVEESFFNSLMSKYKYNLKWFVTYRDVVRSTDVRTMISAILPRVPASRKLPVLGFDPKLPGWAIAANFNALPLDYVARQSIGGISMSFFILKQLPILPPATYRQPCPWSPAQTLHAWLLPRVLELTYTAQDLRGFAEDCRYLSEPFVWDEVRRFLLRCELDAAYFHLYGIARADVDYILDTFPIVRRKDEKEHGEYRTKRVILEIYDAMQQASATGQPYQTLLDPPPAHGWTPPEEKDEGGRMKDEVGAAVSVGAEEPFQLKMEDARPQPGLFDELT